MGMKKTGEKVIDWNAVADYAETHTMKEIASAFFGGSVSRASGNLYRRGIQYLRLLPGRPKKISVKSAVECDVVGMCTKIAANGAFLTPHMIDILSVMEASARARRERSEKRRRGDDRV